MNEKEREEVSDFAQTVIDDIVEKLGEESLLIFLNITDSVINNPLQNLTEHISGKTDD